jgi:hypothetical protein
VSEAAEPFPEGPLLYDFSYFDAVARMVDADDRGDAWPN